MKFSIHTQKFYFTGILASFILLLAGVSGLGQPLQRVANTTLAMPSSPPTFGYSSTNALGTLTFTNPVAIASPPGETNRLFIVEKGGTIFVITNLAAPTKTLFLDISSLVTKTDVNTGGTGEQGLLGMAFHPGYKTNRYFFIYYMGTATTVSTGLHDILSRFQISASNTNQADAASEVRLIAQRDEQPNHNGGDIKFGPDGYLYVPIGDEGAGNDTQLNSQRITKDFFSAMWRLDVDKRPGSLNPNPHASIISPTNYAVPPDNPYVGATNFNGSAVSSNQVRTEFWAVGLRNPWRMSFDPVTGWLYCADVGQSAREEVSIITKGGNYGWNYYEGFATGPGTPPGGFTHILPILDYAHASSRVCIIGGIVYRGARLSQLYGAYLYAEYATGEFWAVKYNGTSITESNLIFNAGSGERPVTFGVDPSNGDALYAAHLTTGHATSAQIKRIIYNTTTNGAPIPTLLSGTGAFTNLTTMAVAPGIVPYDINVHFWSDNAIKSRWFSVPNTNFDIGFNSNANWSFPTGTVWIKHFELELTNGVPESRKRLETRLLVKNTTGLYGVTYRWGNSTTNATLVPEGGMDEAFTINDGGNLRTQLWHYPSWIECQACHTSEGGFGLGFNTPQLNRDYTYPGGTTNILAALAAAGYFSNSIPNHNSLLALAAATNTSASLEHRVRSYLSANCVQCHQPGGSAQQALWNAKITTPTALAGIINGPLTSDFGDTNNHVITPLSTNNSVLLTRISTRGAGTIQMPPIATSIVDTQNVALVTEWIGTLSNTFWIGAATDPQSAFPGDTVTNSITVIATGDFTNNVALSIVGLPGGIGAVFNPSSVTVSGNSSLTLTVSNNAPAGSYPMILRGIGGGKTNEDTLILNIASTVAAPGALLWTGTNGVAANTNWSRILNWTNLTVGGNGIPGLFSDVLFTNNASVSSSTVTNNVVDFDFSIASLQFANNGPPLVANYHKTRIADGVTLTITNNLSVGTGTDAGNNNSVNAAILGLGGTLTVTNPNGLLSIAQGSASDGVHQGILDLSSLGNFNATLGRIALGVYQLPSNTSPRASGVLYLAKTNLISLTSSGTTNGLLIGWNNNTFGGFLNKGSLLFLGQTNAIFTDAISVGTVKTLNCLLAFNPNGLTSPTAYFRGTGGAASRVSLWTIGDDSPLASSNQNTSGTNDFSAGTVDALVDTMYLGRSCTSTNTGSGTGALTFNAGTIDVNTLVAGYQTMVSAANGIGVVNVNGTANLKINTSLELGHFAGATNGAGSASGTLNISSGRVNANTIVSGGGNNVINLNSGTLSITNAIGAPSLPLGTLNTTSSTLGLRLDANSAATNIIVTNLTASGVSTFALESVQNLSGPKTFPLIAYSTFTGSIANFAVTNVPPSYLGTLTDNTANKTIDLRLAIPTNVPSISSITFSGTDLIIAGTNGIANWNYYVLSSTNLSLPANQWTRLKTNSFDANGNFIFTNSPDTVTEQQRFYLLQLP